MSLLARISAALLRLVKRDIGGSRVFWPDTSWQTGSGVSRATELTCSAVFAAIDRISSDIAKIPLRHWRVQPDGTRVELTTSPVLRVWRQPNSYQTGFDLMKAIVSSQLYRGNAYVYCPLNGKNQVVEMHCLSPDAVWPYVFGDQVWYRCSQDQLAEIQPQQMIPARYIFHHRMGAASALLGISPLIAVATTVLGSQAIEQHSMAFFANMARPSGYLTTAGKLDRQKAEELKKRWQDQHGGMGQAGKTPVLEEGLEYRQLTMTAVDAQLIEQLRWGIENIARVFQIPAFLIGDMTRMMARNSEQLMRIYFASCLMAHYVSIAQRINIFWELDTQREYVEFDVDELFRTEFDVRIATFAKAVQGGLATVNEGREGAFSFNPVAGGDQVFMQQQMVPITMLGQQPVGPEPPTADEMAAAFALEVQRRLARWAA